MLVIFMCKMNRITDIYTAGCGNLDICMPFTVEGKNTHIMTHLLVSFIQLQESET